MSKIVGIDLGTTNSLVATIDAGIPLVIADDQGRRLTPSVVHIPGPNREASRPRLSSGTTEDGPKQESIDGLAAGAQNLAEQPGLDRDGLLRG